MLCSTSAPTKISKESPATTYFGGMSSRGAAAMVVGLAVAASTAYVAWSYYPASKRSGDELKKKVNGLKEKAHDLQSNPLDSDGSDEDDTV